MTAFWKFVLEEWYFAFPLLATSMVALTLVFWRLLLNFDARTNLNSFLPQFQEVLETEGVAGALRFCKERTDLIPRRLFVAGLEAYPLGLGAMRQAMAHAAELEILPQVNFLLPPILAVAKVATMLGLLGTVISMIGTFTAISQADTGLEVLGNAGSIGLALFATAIGLVTAIPLVFAHVLFKDWVRKFEVQLKSAAQKLLVLAKSDEFHVAEHHRPEPLLEVQPAPPRELPPLPAAPPLQRPAMPPS
jgi:biopolymer transport protein ExbB